MAKTTKKKAKAAPKPIRPEVANLDLDPDAWPKFEKLILEASKGALKSRQPKKGG